MKLLIVARTCARQSITQGVDRIVSCTREELILKCIDSLIKSANNCNHEITVKILDDNSDDEFLVKLNSILIKSKHPVYMTRLETTGFNHSAHAQFSEGLNAEELVYFVEDDYFHTEDAIDSMINFYISGVTHNYKKFNAIAIYPYDCPHRYWDGCIDPAILFYQGDRYWRTIKHTAFTVMMHSNIVRSFWNIFESVALGYPSITEKDSINLLYSNLVDHGGPVACFSPIPSLANHMSYINEPPNILTDKFVNWQKAWDKYEFN